MSQSQPNFLDFSHFFLSIYKGLRENHTNRHPCLSLSFSSCFSLAFPSLQFQWMVFLQSSQCVALVHHQHLIRKLPRVTTISRFPKLLRLIMWWSMMCNVNFACRLLSVSMSIRESISRAFGRTKWGKSIAFQVYKSLYLRLIFSFFSSLPSWVHLHRWSCLILCS